jgi:hypothetical protein
MRPDNFDIAQKVKQQVLLSRSTKNGSSAF